MDLSAWMTKEGLTDAALAARLKVAGNTVNRWRNRRRRPRASAVAMIYELSAGAVTANDFYHPARSVMEPPTAHRSEPHPTQSEVVPQ